MRTYIIECWGFCFFLMQIQSNGEYHSQQLGTQIQDSFLRPPGPFLSCRMSFQHSAEWKDATVGLHIALMVAAAGKGDNGDLS